MTNIPFSDLDDVTLLDVSRQLAAEERSATATLLRALMEIDSRRLYLGQGCASMFGYCTKVLQMSEAGAYNRIEASRAARAYPVILEMFEQSAITLATVRLLAPHLTPANHVAVLHSARHKSKREVEVLVSALHPRPDAPTMVRKLPAVRAMPAPPGVSAACDLSENERGQHYGVPEDTRPNPLPQQPVAPVCVVPLAPERYRMQLTVSRETYERFRRAQALLRHAVPSGDAAEILDRAITLLLEHLERTRCAQTSRPRVQKTTGQRSRHIPAAVRRQVWRRDAGQCAFVGTSGRCSETGFLEFHHVDPYAAGGAASVENIQLRCRAHNAHEARLFFGAGVVRESRTLWGVPAFALRATRGPAFALRAAGELATPESGPSTDSELP